MILIVFKYIIPKGFRGLTIFPFVFLSKKEDRNNFIFLNHEKIHIKQQIEMLIIPFYLWYLVEFCCRWIQYKNKKMAYFNISFEKEAYSNEKNINYLKSRSFWMFLKYF